MKNLSIFVSYVAIATLLSISSIINAKVVVHHDSIGKPVQIDSKQNFLTNSDHTLFDLVQSSAKVSSSVLENSNPVSTPRYMPQEQQNMQNDGCVNVHLDANTYQGSLWQQHLGDIGTTGLFEMNWKSANGQFISLIFIVNQSIDYTHTYKFKDGTVGIRPGTYTVYTGLEWTAHMGSVLGYALEYIIDPMSGYQQYNTLYSVVNDGMNDYVITSGTITVADGPKGPYIIIEGHDDNSGQDICSSIGELDNSTIKIPLSTNLVWQDNTSTEDWKSVTAGGTGSGNDGKTYDATITVNTNLPTGTFNYSALDLNRTELKVGGTIVPFSDATVTIKESAGNVYSMTATFYGTDGRTYIVSATYSDCATQPELGVFAFTYSAHNIETNLIEDTEEEWNFGTDMKKFIEVIAYDPTTTEKNYIQIYFYVGNDYAGTTQIYSDGVVGPKIGHYEIVKPSFDSEIVGWEQYYYFYIEDYALNNGPVVVQNAKGYVDFYGDWVCPYGSFFTDFNPYTGIVNTAHTYSFDNTYSLDVYEGKDGQMYITISHDGTTFISIGEPGSEGGYKLNISTIGSGTVTKDPDECWYAEGSTVTLTPTPATGWQFAEWTGDCKNNVTDNHDGTYTYTIPANNCSLTAKFTQIKKKTELITKCSSDIPFFWRDIEINSPATQNGMQITKGDSIITLQLIINQAYKDIVDKRTMCANEMNTFTWEGETFTQYANITEKKELSIDKQLTSLSGCDSLVTLQLTIIPNRTIIDKQVMHAGKPITWYGKTITGIENNGDTVHVYEGGEGNCYTVMKLDLTVINDDADFCVNMEDLFATSTLATTSVYHKTSETEQAGTHVEICSWDTIGNAIVDYGENDPRTRHHLFTAQGNDLRQPALKVIPDGETTSIRLGNPFGSKTTGGESPEGEAISFNMTITESNALILFKWAAVLELSNHPNSTLHPRFRPQQIVYFTDKDGKKLDTQTSLDNGTYRYYFERYGVADLGLIGWKEFTANDYDGKQRTAYWQDWITTGFDMRNYIGQTVQLHVENFECAVEEQITTVEDGVQTISTKFCGTEYGYIYFHVSCHELNLTAECYEDEPNLHAYKISAPEGFVYKWTKNNQAIPEANGYRDILIRADGNTKYTCQLIYNQGGGVYTEISVLPPFAHAYLTDTICASEKATFRWNGYTFDKFHKDATSPYYYVHDTVSCDTMTTMQLFVAETYNTPLTQTITSNQLPYTWEGIIFDKEGTQEVHKTSIYGCDSILTLTLKVDREVRTTDFVTKCANELPFMWNGIQINSMADNGKTATLTSTVGGDSIVTLQLTIKDATPIGNVDIVEKEICADDAQFTLAFHYTKGEPTTCDVIFDNDAIQQGFTNQTGINVTDGMNIIILIPTLQSESLYVRPDTYSGTLHVKDECQQVSQFEFSFTIFYPSWIILQRWNDVLALYNENYNGGHTFSDITWYHEGQPITGKGDHNSQVYTKELGFDHLDFGTKYWAELTRTSDGKRLRTCAIEPVEVNENAPISPKAPEIRLSHTIVGLDNRLININANISGQYILYYSNGKRLQTGKFGDEYGNSTLSIDPNYPAGTYIVVFYGDEGSVISHKLFLK